MKLFWNPSNDPAFNLALEECMTRSLKGQSMMLWRNSPSVIVGRNQNTLAEVDKSALDALRVPAVRRMTGGGAVYHDFGNLNYSCMADTGSDLFSAFDIFAKPVMDALRSFGLTPAFTGRNDILVDGRKVSGTAKTFIGKRVLFHGTLLFDTDLTVLEKVLTPDPEKFAFKGIRSVRSRVANLHEFLPDMTKEEFPRAMRNALGKLFEAEESELQPDILEKAQALAESKYRRWEWNFGGSPAYSFHRKKRFPGGTVELSLDIRHGKIEHAAFTGDFFGECPVCELEALLCGTELRPDAIKSVLAGIDTEKYLLGVGREALAELFE